ncbi:hypothetical protein RND81_09G103200 [Saponaria officinalis]|uniref:very-long-chain 3-oxoacyl-CoA synthase n=1 Tax=Saponaria officinalis TaxID=3572 RepID=A0AAW1IL32_SAPOF
MAVMETINYYLVHQPMISTFNYTHGTTAFSTVTALVLTVLVYLSATLLFSTTAAIPSLPPPLLRRISAAHNILILLLSFTMALGATLSAVSQSPSLHWVFCFPANRTLPRGPVFFWGYVFYLSKILEFIDTLLIILGGTKSSRRLSFLHVYHHAMVVVMCYIWLETSQSLFIIALITNVSVHTVMYAYYLMCSLGIRPSWKRFVTDVQIVQFVFSFVVSLVMLYYHFTQFECSGFKGWCFNAVFNASLLYLFIDFHSKNYKNKKRRKKTVEKVGDDDDDKVV